MWDSKILYSTWSLRDRSAFIQQLFEPLLCARLRPGHQGCSSEQDQPGAGAALDFTCQDPALIQLHSSERDKLKTQDNVRLMLWEKINLGKVKVSDWGWEEVEGSLEMLTRGGH